MSQITKVKKPIFQKRIYTYPEFRASVEQIFDNIDDLRQARRRGSVNKAFAEKIMLVVSAVNDCRYCSFGHSRAALEAGISEDEVRSLLALDFEKFSVNETKALVFAQHYTESNYLPDPVAWQQIVTHYSEDTANDILVYIRLITFGNLLGNTFDALLSRLAGKPAPGSSLWSELSVLLGVLWLPPYRLLRRKFNRKHSAPVMNE